MMTTALSLEFFGGGREFVTGSDFGLEKSGHCSLQMDILSRSLLHFLVFFFMSAAFQNLFAFKCFNPIVRCHKGDNALTRIVPSL
jgi:hypothetical protein